MISASEKQVWGGGPSQMLNVGTYILCLLFCWLVLPIFYALWKYLEVKCMQYSLTSERLKVSRGVLNRVTDELELYRVKDTRLEEPLLLRMFKLGNVVMATSDRSHPLLVLRGLKNAEAVREQLRELVEMQRKLKGVREID